MKKVAFDMIHLLEFLCYEGKSVSKLQIEIEINLMVAHTKTTFISQHNLVAYLET